MRIRVPLQLRWGDLDAYGHVNNATVFRLLEEARVRALWAPPAGERTLPTAVTDTDGPTMTLIAGHRIEYLRPLDYQREPVEVQLWFTSIGGASAALGYELVAGDPAEVCVRATSTLVNVDRADGRPRRIGAAERAAWSPYLGEAVAFSRRD